MARGNVAMKLKLVRKFIFLTNSEDPISAFEKIVTISYNPLPQSVLFLYPLKTSMNIFSGGIKREH